MKGIRKLSTGKKFLMSLLATTVSIVLTFGTTAIIDRKKQRAAKRSNRTDSVSYTPAFLVKASESPQALYRIL